MVTEIREIELKYDAAPGVSLPDLTDLPHVEAQSEPDEQILEATYYDTDGLDLARAQITLRRRLGGDDAGWHLKLPEAAGERAELRLPPGGEQVPAELTTLLTARLRGRPVRPVARISTTRQRSRLRDHDGAVLAEVVLDRVTAQTLVGEPPTTLRWSEIEVELGEGGGPRLLKAADRQLRRNGLRRSRHSSKLAAVLGDRLPAPAVGPRPKSSASAGETVLFYLRTQIEELLACDPAVRRDIPDSVHRMRVASRRLRSTLQSFRPLLRREQTEPLIGELRWLGEVLGRSRDDEVLREHLAASLGEVPVELVLGPVPGRLTAHFAPRQAQGREALLEALGSERYLVLLDGLDRLASGAMLAPEADRHAASALPPLVWRTFRRTRRRMGMAHAASDGGRREVALHEARKAAKRARYAAEAAAPVVGKTARRSVKSLKKIQSALGEHQDTVIARQAVRQLGVRANAAGENAFTYGLLHARQTELAQAARDRADKAWKQASRKKNIAWMH